MCKLMHLMHRKPHKYQIYDDIHTLVLRVAAHLLIYI